MNVKVETATLDGAFNANFVINQTFEAIVNVLFFDYI